MDRWDQVLAALQDSVGNKASVAVYPGADIQYVGNPVLHDIELNTPYGVNKNSFMYR